MAETETETETNASTYSVAAELRDKLAGETAPCWAPVRNALDQSWPSIEAREARMRAAEAAAEPEPEPEVQEGGPELAESGPGEN